MRMRTKSWRKRSERSQGVVMDGLSSMGESQHENPDGSTVNANKIYCIDLNFSSVRFWTHITQEEGAEASRASLCPKAQGCSQAQDWGALRGGGPRCI